MMNWMDAREIGSAAADTVAAVWLLLLGSSPDQKPDARREMGKSSRLTLTK
jgi:hypothetical protein